MLWYESSLYIGLSRCTKLTASHRFIAAHFNSDTFYALAILSAVHADCSTGGRLHHGINDHIYHSGINFRWHVWLICRVCGATWSHRDRVWVDRQCPLSAADTWWMNMNGHNWPETTVWNCLLLVLSLTKHTPLLSTAKYTKDQVRIRLAFCAYL